MDSSTCNTMPIKKFKELSTAWALEQVAGDPECMSFVSDSWLKPKAKLSRQYLF
jgi:hypothetical protein